MPQNPCQIYYYGFIEDDKHSSVKSHKHPFWQLEILLNGEFSFSFANKTITVKAPSIIFIPPDVIHRFQYDYKLVKILSLKFQLASKHKDFQTNIHPILHPINYIIDAVEYEIIQNPLTSRLLLENLTNSLWSHFHHHIDEKIKKNLNDKIKAFIESKKGRSITIHNVAQKFNLSDSHTSSYFSKNNALSLKEYIDERRIYFSKTLLLYSENNISEIANELEFKDLYSFSHFFKRKTKLTPSEFKKNGHI